MRTRFAILASTTVGLLLRIYQLTQHDYAFGVTEYDDGVYFGAALRFIHGGLPYQDFLLVHPPGIVLLLTPIAELSRWIGEPSALLAARIGTVGVSTANIALIGALLSQHGTRAALAGSALAAVAPADIAAAHTVLLEPWTGCGCLLGLLAVQRGRYASGGLAFGVAAAIKLWAFRPALVLLLVIRRARFGGCVLLGFAAIAGPFAICAPSQFFRAVFLAQIDRHDSIRTPLEFRLTNLTGLPAHITPVIIAGMLITLAAIDLNTINNQPTAEIPDATGIPANACGLTDESSLTIAADRFADCAVPVDAVGTDYALGDGRNGDTRAGDIPAVQQAWLAGFRSANCVWLTGLNARRIPWTPALWNYFHTHFTQIGTGRYRRTQ